jgi:hypothetical protein
MSAQGALLGPNGAAKTADLIYHAAATLVASLMTRIKLEGCFPDTSRYRRIILRRDRHRTRNVDRGTKLSCPRAKEFLPHIDAHA